MKYPQETRAYVTVKTLETLAHSLHTLGVSVPVEKHTLMDGKVHVYRRPRSRFWQCSTYLGGQNHRTSTKEELLVLAKEFAQGWYMERYAADRQRRRGDAALVIAAKAAEVPAGTGTPSLARRRRTPKGVRTFHEAADAFRAEYEVLVQGERNAKYVEGKWLILSAHLLPFFGDRPLVEITAGLVQEYRAHRMTSRLGKDGAPKRPSRSTLHSEVVTLRQILKTANRKGWLAAIPDLSVPYKTSGKVVHRAWFSPDEYKLLYEATRERAANPKNERWRRASEEMHDYVLFMANTGLRVDECAGLQYRDVTIVKDQNNGGERILEIEVRGKRGTGYCKSMPGAVLPFQRMQKRSDGKPTDPIFGKVRTQLFNNILDELDLKRDREGNVRTAYSLRHTYICLRLMEGADIYAIAKNCRTSVEMIEKHYAAHIKNQLDTRVINVRREKVKPPSLRKPAKKKAE